MSRHLRDRDRCRHDRRAQPGRVRRRRAGRRRRTASSPSTSRSRAGSSTTPTEIWERSSRHAERGGRPGRARRTSPRSASPTSARPSSPGTASTGRAVRHGDRLAGPAHRGPLRRARRPTVTSTWCAQRTGLVLDPYFSGTKFEWLLARARHPGRRRSGARHDRRLADLEPDRRRGPRHRRDQRQPHDAVRHRRPRVERRAVRPARTCRSTRCPRCAVERTVRRHLRPVRRARRHPDQRRRRRPAGGAVRAGLLRAGHGQEHVRHRAASCCSTSGDSCPPPTEGMLTTVAWELADGTVAYALEGAIFVTGAAVQWLRDGLGIIDDAAETGPLADSVADTGGVYVVPAFTGLGSPVVGPVRARHDRRHHPWHDPSPHRPCRRRVDGVPDPRRRRCDGRRERHADRRPARRRRRVGDGPACCRCRPTSSASPCGGRATRRPPHSARRTSPAWPRACGPTSTRSPRRWQLDADVRARADDRTFADLVHAQWLRAVERAREQLGRPSDGRRGQDASRMTARRRSGRTGRAAPARDRGSAVRSGRPRPTAPRPADRTRTGRPTSHAGRRGGGSRRGATAPSRRVGASPDADDRRRRSRATSAHVRLGRGGRRRRRARRHAGGRLGLGQLGRERQRQQAAVGVIAVGRSRRVRPTRRRSRGPRSTIRSTSESSGRATTSSSIARPPPTSRISMPSTSPRTEPIRLAT